MKPRRAIVSNSRRGASAVVVAVTAGVLFAFAGLVVDFGVARLVQSQLQATTDAAALAGARRLDGTTVGLTLARETAVDVAGANEALGDAVILDENAANAANGDVVLGVWDRAAETFTPSLDAEHVDAVQVRARRDDLHTWFLLLMGRDQLATSVVSIAERGRDLGAGRVPWYLPFSLPKCQIDEHGEEGITDITFVLAPSGTDNVGWGAVDDNPNSAWAVDHIEDMLPCMQEWNETGTVTEPCSEVSSGSTVNLGNGDMTSALKELAETMGDGIPWSNERWGTLPKQNANSNVAKADYGTVLEGPIPIFDAGAAYCTPSASWNETFPVLGFVWGVIYDVRWKGSAAQKNVWVRVDTSEIYDIGEWYGGGDWGVTYSGPPVLVW